MSLKFYSNYPVPINISILFLDTKCDGSFVKQGWWEVTYGKTTEPYAGNLHDQNRYFYFFAEAQDGNTWSGDNLVQVTTAAFNQCVLDNTGCDWTVGFIELDIRNSSSATVELNYNGWQWYVPPEQPGESFTWGDSSDDSED